MLYVFRPRVRGSLISMFLTVVVLGAAAAPGTGASILFMYRIPPLHFSGNPSSIQISDL